MEDEHQDTEETAALAGEQVSLEPEDAAAVGDPAAASVDADPGPDPVAFVPPSATAAGPTGTSPAEADRRAEPAESPPFAAIGGAFVGAFVAAKLLGRLGGGDDD